MENNINIRKAAKKDFDALYALGKSTPELQASATEEFMDADEFLSVINSRENVFLIAVIDNIPVGFIYATTNDLDKPLRNKWACLVYLAVSPEYRKRGIAQKLYDACVAELKTRGIRHIYAWANCESDGAIIKFNKKQGFREGHKYIWMDKEI